MMSWREYRCRWVALRLCPRMYCGMQSNEYHTHERRHIRASAMLIQIQTEICDTYICCMCFLPVRMFLIRTSLDGWAERRSSIGNDNDATKQKRKTMTVTKDVGCKCRQSTLWWDENIHESIWLPFPHETNQRSFKEFVYPCVYPFQYASLHGRILLSSPIANALNHLTDNLIILGFRIITWGAANYPHRSFAICNSISDLLLLCACMDYSYCTSCTITSATTNGSRLHYLMNEK